MSMRKASCSISLGHKDIKDIKDMKYITYNNFTAITIICFLLLKKKNFHPGIIGRRLYKAFATV